MNAKISALLLSVLVSTACGQGVVEEEDAPLLDPSVLDGIKSGEDGTLEQGLTSLFNQNKLLENEDITGHQWVTVQQVQSFLRLQGSYLANYSDPASGKSAATLIVEKSKASHISPLYILARIQIESRLITSGTSTNLSKATGCGCPDGSSCSTQYSGFARQVQCAAEKMRNYLTDLEQRGYTVSGWRVGVARRTGDPCTVTPANKATAALYTYTPWVGAYGAQCGRNDVGGSSLVAAVYARFKSSYNFGQPPPPSGDPVRCTSTTLGKQVPVNTCVQGVLDSLWHICESDGNFSGGTWRKPDGCLSPAFPFCDSYTLGRGVPARTCVQSRTDREWYQCGASGNWLSAPRAGAEGDGPMGTCLRSYDL